MIQSETAIHIMYDFKKSISYLLVMYLQLAKFVYKIKNPEFDPEEFRDHPKCIVKMQYSSPPLIRPISPKANIE